jgi:hypothetical protein
LPAFANYDKPWCASCGFRNAPREFERGEKGMFEKRVSVSDECIPLLCG